RRESRRSPPASKGGRSIASPTRSGRSFPPIVGSSPAPGGGRRSSPEPARSWRPPRPSAPGSGPWPWRRFSVGSPAPAGVAPPRLSLDEAGAHRMALRAMEQYGLLLAGLCPAAKAVGDLGSARRLAARGRTPVLLVAPILERSRRLERSFRLTSDSIAAFIAGRVRAPRLVLVKSRPGGDGLPLRVGALRELARRGVVDPLFPALAPRRSDVRIIDGTDAAGWEGLLAEEAREAGGPVRPRAGRRGRRSPGPDRGRR